MAPEITDDYWDEQHRLAWEWNAELGDYVLTLVEVS